ncbi:MAG TPA: hypothetical protein VHH73_14825 [Verrucomicrobiae bacterium]|nr:hypothetical protein [Verrucomicrobiae bacterium]
MRIYSVLKRREELRGKLDEIFQNAQNKSASERSATIADERALFSELGALDAELDDFRTTLDQLLHAALCEAESLLKDGKTVQLASLLATFRDLPHRRAELDEVFLKKFRARLEEHQVAFHKAESDLMTNYLGIFDHALQGSEAEEA